jgi:hypothetical protein
MQDNQYGYLNDRKKDDHKQLFALSPVSMKESGMNVQNGV